MIKMIKAYVERFRHPIILVGPVLSILYAFGFDSFPIIEQNTKFVVMGASAIGAVVYFLYYVQDAQPEYEEPLPQTPPPQTPQQPPPMTQRPTPMQGQHSFKELEEKEAKLNKQLEALDKMGVKPKKDIFDEFEEVKKDAK